MPTFEPAAPVAPGIQSDYGATEQWNKTFPALAGLYEAAGRNANQAAGETARNQTQANISSGELDARQRMQYVQDRAAQDQQERQFQQQSDLQNQAAFNEAALSGIKVSQVEQAHMQRQQNAVNSILQMTNDGTLDMSDPEVRQQVNDAIFEAKTGINSTQRRLQNEEAERNKAQANLDMQRAASQQVITNKNLELQGRSTEQNTRIHLDPKMEQEERAKLAPKYNALAAVIGADAAQQAYDNEVKMNVTAKGGAQREVIESYDSHGAAKWRPLDKPANPQAHPIVNEFTDKSGGLDMTAVLKDAKAFAERKLGPRPKLTKDSTQDDKDAQKQWDQLVSDRADGIERLQKYPGKSVAERQAAETASQQAASQPPTSASTSAPAATPNDPSQQAQAANDQRDALSKIAAQIPQLANSSKEKIDAMPISNLLKTQLKGYVDEANKISVQPHKTDEDWRNYNNYKRLFEEQLKKWG